MPVTIKKSASAHAKAFFQALGGQPLFLFQALRGMGVEVEVEVQSLQVKAPGQTFGAIILPVASSAVVKGFVPPSMKPGLVTKVAKYLDQCISVMGGGKGVVLADTSVPAAPAPGKASPFYFSEDGSLKATGTPASIPTSTGPTWGMPASDVATAQAMAGMDLATGDSITVKAGKIIADLDELIKPEYKPVSGAFEPVKVDLNTPVPLAEASALNQAVKGTSASSIYRVIALGPRVKMAARFKGGQLSVRVEGDLNASESVALDTLGFKKMTGYRSNHYNLAGTGIPPERVVGAIFLTEGIELTMTIKKLSEVADGQ